MFGAEEVVGEIDGLSFSGLLKYFSLSGKIVNNPCVQMTGRLLGFIGVVQREKRTQNN